MARYAKNLIRSEVNTPKQREVIMTRIGDVKGSSDLDVIYLVGNERGTGKNKVYYNMQIIISDGENGKTVTIDLSGIEGYNPRIELENFKKVTSDNEILFSVEDIGNNGYLTAHMYYLDGDKAIKIFDTDYYNQLDSYQVIYQDKYKVDVIDINRGMTYSIDISGKDKDYLNSLYNNNGILKKRIAGKVLSVSGLSPINLRRSNILDLLVTQKIIGINEKDILGVMSNILSFEGISFIKVDSFIGILGEKTPNMLVRGENKLSKDCLDFSKVEFIESEVSKDEAIERIIEKEFSLNPDEDKVNYLYNKVKLKDDDSYQVLVYLEGPRFCTERGGTLAILEEKNNEYNVLSKISNAINPIIISENKTNGYRDLIVKMIDSDKDDFRLLKFNGNAYPLDPVKEERLKRGSKIKGIAAISDDLFYTRGIEYK
ncbi:MULTISPECIES: hypothetical protein [Clostridium]|jgi:hypothetical protein|uniref:hypothetical protein n=1 Tax=Clostridium TaxID=1485 RepID=UPI001C1E026E|nr:MULTISPECIES: hypothetical protein [Clostridium]MBU6135657.1 hypothetical protein [Clostridium tertium]MDB1940856.1 hypothetical protein [Clostridium tertium]MDU1565844.1 hypothetical protein [Clostridium sp.]MDU2157372.1 hypothetical protein [Clostridium sp.]MDU2683721.1 hypothetical protein [Clostridium sp.]